MVVVIVFYVSHNNSGMVGNMVGDANSSIVRNNGGMVGDVVGCLV